MELSTCNTACSAYNTSRFDIPLFNVTWTNGLEYFKDQTKTGVITDQTNPSDAEWFSGPTPAGALSLPLVVFTTACLLASSATVHMAEKRLEGGNQGGFIRWWL